MNTRNEILRQIIAVFLAAIFAVLFSLFDLNLPSNFVATIFAVLGIFYSITMSLTISFDYRAVTNKQVRDNIREALKHIKASNTVNFLITTAIMLVCSPFSGSNLKPFVRSFLDLWPLWLIVVSFVLSIMTFNNLFNLKNQLEDAITKEQGGL